MLGDFNNRCSEWDSDHNRSELGLKLFDFINSQDLHQLILEPTHIVVTPTYTSANILDLLITDSPGYIHNYNQGVLPPIGSKHQVIFAELKIQYKWDKTYLREVWSYNQGNYPALLDDLRDVPWDLGQELFQDIDNITECWQKTFLRGFQATHTQTTNQSSTQRQTVDNTTS